MSRFLAARGTIKDRLKQAVPFRLQVGLNTGRSGSSVILLEMFYCTLYNEELFLFDATSTPLHVCSMWTQPLGDMFKYSGTVHTELK